MNRQYIEQSNGRKLYLAFPPKGSISSNDLNRLLFVNGHATHTKKVIEDREVDIFTPYRKRSYVSAPALPSLHLPCICCGTAIDTLHEYQPVTIGCLVVSKRQRPADDFRADEEYYQRYTATATGLGCLACMAKYNAAVGTVGKLNAQMAELRTQYAAQAVLKEQLQWELRDKDTQLRQMQVHCIKHRMQFCAACGVKSPYKLVKPPMPKPVDQKPYIDVEERVRELKLEWKSRAVGTEENRQKLFMAEVQRLLNEGEQVTA